ncbi:MAG: AAA family ATPase [Pseudomonadota bacterium]
MPARPAAQPVPNPAATTLARSVIDQLSKVILGKELQLQLALTCLISRGHLLIEDLPGVGKTTLAQALARVLGLSFQRVQFTSDMLPADIIGVSVYERNSGDFRFHKGPVFAQLVLADEVNRATAKTQSALLEAMEEYQVTVDGQTYALPQPFFVVATQNPAHQIGTFPLPESQLDRFLMSMSLGYPPASLERTLISGADRREVLDGLEPSLALEDFLALQRLAPKVHLSDPILDYIQAIVAYTRQSPEFDAGLSPRAAIALGRAAQAWALIQGHRGVLPEDVQAVAPAVVGHRLRHRDQTAGLTTTELGETVVGAVAIP